MQVLSSTQNLPLLNLLRVGIFLVYLGGNQISAVGLIQMPDSKINRLKEFQLCLFFINQSRTTSVLLASNFWLKQNFLYLSYCSLVVIYLI